jgi:hypothetical protein
MDEAAANAAITNDACAPDLEAPLDKSVAGSTVGPICRICLSAGSAEQELIQPCACTGTVGYIHAACLTAWVQERGSLTCKICQQRYKEPFAQALQQHQQTAAAEEGHEERQTSTISCCNWLMNYGIGQAIRGSMLHGHYCLPVSADGLLFAATAVNFPLQLGTLCWHATLSRRLLAAATCTSPTASSAI